MITTTTDASTKLAGKQLEPHVDALMGASGITEDQARVSVLYALSTYRRDLDRMPLLAIIGMTGTGKSVLVKQLEFLVDDRCWASGYTVATVRDEMPRGYTYLVDEGDGTPEWLLLCRTSKDISRVTHKTRRGPNWIDKTVNVFGATVLARRTPFRDAAVRNRAIVISTRSRPGEYVQTFIEGFDEIARQLRVERLELGSGRVQDTWAPLKEAADAIDDPSFADAVATLMAAETKIFRSGQDYEPELVLLHALDGLTWDESAEERLAVDVKLTDLVARANEEGDVALGKKQSEEVLMMLGFRVTFTRGVKYVRADSDLLESLL